MSFLEAVLVVIIMLLQLIHLSPWKALNCNINYIVGLLIYVALNISLY